MENTTLKAKASFTSAELVDLLEAWVDKYPIITIEDGFAKTIGKVGNCLLRNWATKFNSLVMICSLRTRSVYPEGIEKGIGNSILVKVNQIGTLTETFDAIEMAKRAGYTAVISHRSGETEDSTIADIAVATNAGQIKTGAPSRTDRVAKYNQFLRIEDQLGETAQYNGLKSFYNLKK